MGPRGRRFESCHPDFTFVLQPVTDRRCGRASIEIAMGPKVAVSKMRTVCKVAPVKVLSFFLITACLVSLGTAQVAAPSKVDLKPTPTPFPDELAPGSAPLPSVPQMQDLSRLDEAFKHTSIGKAADDNRERIEIRTLQNRIADDPDIVAAKKNAEAARTDLEKRERLRAYYQLAYGRMRRSASSGDTRKALDDEEAAHLKLLDQPRVRPVPGGTIPPVETKTKAEKKKKAKLGRVIGS